MFPVSQSSLIAIVDDDASVRRSIRRLLASAGYRVQTFASAEAFLDSPSGSRAACVVLDVHLDGMNGFDLQARLAADGVRIPIIFITAHDDVATRARLGQSRAAGHLWKPFDDAALLDSIRRVVEPLDEGPIGSPGAGD